MAQRRDMRHFTPGAQVAPEVLERLLLAAHAGPSVGFMQPWRFLRITDAGLRERIHACVDRERVATARILMNSTKYRIGFNNVKLCAHFGILSIGVNKPLINMKITIKNHAINIACCWVSV